MPRPSNDFQFLELERVDPPKRDMQRRVGEFVEIYDPFNAAKSGHAVPSLSVLWQPLLRMEMPSAQLYSQLAATGR